VTAFWDASALIEVILSTPAAVAAFDTDHVRLTRAHALVESFSQLTGGRILDQNGEAVRLEAASATEAIAAHAAKMKVVTLDERQTLAALKTARKKGVRGGHVHDLMHATAAELHGAERIYTLNVRHFSTVTDLEVLAP
jgi:hypothetical protein